MTKIEMEYMESVKKIAREISKPKEIDWEKRRYQIAKDYMAATYTMPGYRSDSDFADCAKFAVKAADALIAELKKKEQ